MTVPQTVSAGKLQQANALMSVSRRATAVAGPTVSGLIIALVGPGPVFLIDAGTNIQAATKADTVTPRKGGRPLASRTALWLHRSVLQRLVAHGTGATNS